MTREKECPRESDDEDGKGSTVDGGWDGNEGDYMAEWRERLSVAENRRCCCLGHSAHPP